MWTIYREESLKNSVEGLVDHNGLLDCQLDTGSELVGN